MPNTATATRPVRISVRKAANTGPAYLEQFLGLRVVERTAAGDEFVGNVTRFADGIPYAIVTAPDGRWMRAASADVLHAVVDACEGFGPFDCTLAADHAGECDLVG